jgi:hypothetical protein
MFTKMVLVAVAIIEFSGVAHSTDFVSLWHKTFKTICPAQEIKLPNGRTVWFTGTEEKDTNGENTSVSDGPGTYIFQGEVPSMCHSNHINCLHNHDDAVKELAKTCHDVFEE